MDMREHQPGYRETTRMHCDISQGLMEHYINLTKRWDRIFYEKGVYLWQRKASYNFYLQVSLSSSVFMNIQRVSIKMMCGAMLCLILMLTFFKSSLSFYTKKDKYLHNLIFVLTDKHMYVRINVAAC